MQWSGDAASPGPPFLSPGLPFLSPGLPGNPPICGRHCGRDTLPGDRKYPPVWLQLVPGDLEWSETHGSGGAAGLEQTLVYKLEGILQTAPSLTSCMLIPSAQEAPKSQQRINQGEI